MLSIYKVPLFLQQAAALALPGSSLSWCPEHVYLLLREQLTLIPAGMGAEHTWGSSLQSGGHEGSLFAQITARTCPTLMYFSSKLWEQLYQPCFWNNSCCVTGSTVPGCSVPVKTGHYVLENQVLAKGGALLCPVCLLWMLNCTRTVVCSAECMQNSQGTKIKPSAKPSWQTGNNPVGLSQHLPWKPQLCHHSPAQSSDDGSFHL